VLTGGPCGGKSTALAHLKEGLEKDEYRVFTVSEAATLLHSEGFDFAEDMKTEERNVNVQTQIMRLQMQHEDALEAIAAKSGNRSVARLLLIVIVWLVNKFIVL